ncbi:hypothetical protein PBY51_010522 [Eleginops maclovinus]|uniref:Rho-GAP domain-containing protein n=1 Tax=Eleginops maclovinus TaxID=56733 RepID=A0AAN7X421_ELEMC|nr:hypothetical protein PBY51_010522 [Eleginops maclovinus]
MKVMEKNMMRLVAVQHLRAAYGIKTKNWNKNKAVSCKTAATNSTKVFGVSLETLPYYNMECGSVPSFLVDASLRAKLDAGEECLSTALPCDIAGLVKQFFRELPEPVLPTELQEAFLKAQQLPAKEDRTSATMLLSCVLPEKNLSILRHFLDFLYNVSMRSAENKMDSSNLSVILAPNILHSGDGTEKMNAHTEKRLKLQAAIVHCFIENAHNFGVLPQFLLEKVPAMMGCEAGVLSPSHDGLEELDLNSGMKKKLRRSFGDMVNGALNKIKTNRTPTNASLSDSLVFSSATPVIATPSSKRKLPLESGQSFGFSNKKHRSVKKTLGIDLLSNTLFSATSTPGSAYSASGVLDSPHNPLSSAGKSRRMSAISVRRKSRRLSNRHAVNRVESGRAGCFSPKVSKKEAPRKSLRLRFSLGKSSKEAVSESIGWRLAMQESTTSFRFTEETEFSPAVLPRKAASKGTKYISKSEDNLLTPQCDSSVHQTSWSGETPGGAQTFRGGSFTDTPMNICLKNNYNSEPAIVVLKPPAVSSFPKKLCCAPSAESLESEFSITEAQSQTAPTLMKIKKAFTESRSDLQDPCNSEETDASKTFDGILPQPQTPTTKVLPVDTCASSFPAVSLLAYDQNITFGQLEIAALSPLHIDSVLFESGAYRTPAAQAEAGSFCAAPISSHNSSTVGESDAEEEQLNCSRLVDALDIQSPAHFKLWAPSGRQSTPYRLGLEFRDEFSTPPKIGTKHCAVQNQSSSESGAEKQQPLSPRSLETEKRRVADHIHHFNKLTLLSPKGALAKHVRSPLQFKRTPVRQTVRRMNSLLGESRRPVRKEDLSISQNGPMMKAVSLESGLSPHPQLQLHLGEGKLPNSVCHIKKPPPVPPKKPSTLARKAKVCALADLTNKFQPKTNVDSSDQSGAQKPLLEQVEEKDMSHYRGSPRNPLNQVRLMSATKPVDL